MKCSSRARSSSLDHEDLHCQAFANVTLCCLKIGAGPIGDELRPKIPGLIPHQVIPVHPLPQSTSRGLRATSTNRMVRLRRIEDSVDAMSFGQRAATTVVESDDWRAQKLRKL